MSEDFLPLIPRSVLRFGRDVRVLLSEGTDSIRSLLFSSLVLSGGSSVPPPSCSEILFLTSQFLKAASNSLSKLCIFFLLCTHHLTLKKKSTDFCFSCGWGLKTCFDFCPRKPTNLNMLSYFWSNKASSQNYAKTCWWQKLTAFSLMCQITFIHILTRVQNFSFLSVLVRKSTIHSNFSKLFFITEILNNHFHLVNKATKIYKLILYSSWWRLYVNL